MCVCVCLRAYTIMTPPLTCMKETTTYLAVVVAGGEAIVNELLNAILLTSRRPSPFPCRRVVTGGGGE